jgi:hypothetical protein
MFTGFEEISGFYWSGIKCMAKTFNRDLDISISEAYDLYVKQNKKCAISGVPIYFSKIAKGINTASLDRIDSSLGYIKNNIQWVHKDINRMKLNFAQSYFLELCRYIVDCAK